jgi:hypothetical protein
MVLIVVGVVLWLINRFIPMQGTIKSILNAVVVIAVVLWLLNVSGLFSSFSHTSKNFFNSRVEESSEAGTSTYSG